MNGMLEESAKRLFNDSVRGRRDAKEYSALMSESNGIN